MSRRDSIAPDISDSAQASPPTDSPPLDSVSRHHRRNFAVLALYHIVLRIGWIFKIESVVIPAVLDSLGGSATLRGWLPLLNRFGLSLPPVLFARRLRGISKKKWALFGCTLAMAAAFLSLASIWWFAGGRVLAWMPVAFLVIYFLFFVATGLNQLSLGTLQGKLIRADRRGRLMAMATVVGVVMATVSAALLMPRWLENESCHFEYMFAFTGLMFLLSAFTAIMFCEPADPSQAKTGRLWDQFPAAWRVVRHDRNFRRLAVVAMLFGTSMMAFPHYLALAREKLNLKMDNIVIWVIVQNVGTALISLAAGPLADRRGTRLTLRVLIFGSASVPLLAAGLANAPGIGGWSYSVVFLLIGLTPITFRMFTNYTLEVTQAENHPRYLSVMSLCLALPSLASPLVGYLVDIIGYEIVFGVISALTLISWCLSVRLIEPRDHVPALEELATPPDMT